MYLTHVGMPLYVQNAASDMMYAQFVGHQYQTMEPESDFVFITNALRLVLSRNEMMTDFKKRKTAGSI